MTNRVAILKNNLKSKGGLEKYTFRIANAFTQRGIDVDILSADEMEKDPKSPLIRTVKLPIQRTLKFRKLEEFDDSIRNHLAKTKYDIVFGMDRTSHQTHLRAGNGVHAAFLKRRMMMDPLYKRLSIPFNPIHRTILNLEKSGFESPTLETLFCNSNMVKEEVLSHYNVAPEKIQVVHNGVEWHEKEKDFSNWIENKNRLLTQLKLDPNVYHFLFCGHSYKRKGLAPLLEALATLPRKDFHLSVIGKEKHMYVFEALVNKLKLKNKVRFFGEQTNTTPFYQIADSIVIPSFYDPFANVTLEALAMGVYVVSSEFNGGKEILEDTNGVVIPDLLDKESFRETLLEAMDNPKTWIRSQNIRESVKYLEFSNQLRKILNNCIKQP